MPPKLPKLSDIIKGNPVREIVEDGRQLISGAVGNISDIASAIRVEGDETPETETEEPETEPVSELEEPLQEDEVKGGTAGKLCSDEHVSQVASNLKEALRMARSRGIKDKEIRDRLLASRDELNAMERFDMVAEKIRTYSPEEQVIAKWLLPKSAAMRHAINEILMQDKDIDDLEKLSAYASDTTRELTDRIDALPKEVKGTDECLEVKKLSTFLEEQKLKKQQVSVKDASDFLKKRGALK
jgi:hypothetical protein